MAREKKEKGTEQEADAVRYGAAVAEIEQILASIDRDEIDIDELSAKVERAVELLKICRARLKAGPPLRFGPSGDTQGPAARVLAG